MKLGEIDGRPRVPVEEDARFPLSGLLAMEGRKYKRAGIFTGR